ncbi:putative lipoprotein [Mycobacteroides abscessus subsp. abscessus]|nr:putative lipoprotein [Mycobacteroides abscessus subsp. abscessus]
MDHGSMDMGDGAGGMGMMSEQEMTAMENARGQEFDTLWLNGMIAHHQGAIDMAKTELADGIDPASRALAEQITTSQQAEIDRMRSMLGQ